MAINDGSVVIEIDSDRIPEDVRDMKTTAPIAGTGNNA